MGKIVLRDAHERSETRGQSLSIDCEYKRLSESSRSGLEVLVQDWVKGRTMSTSSKPSDFQYSEKINPRETGTWRAGITNPDLLKLFGEIFSDWVHTEEAMIPLIDVLVLSDVDIRLTAAKMARGFSPGRQIFRSMNANKPRGQMMANLLNHYPGNDAKKKDPIYERAIKQFQSLVTLRNDYLHGLWWTKSDGEVYLQTENVEETMFNRKRRIPRKDFESFIRRMTKLRRDVEAIEIKEYRVSDERRAELATRSPSSKSP